MKNVRFFLVMICIVAGFAACSDDDPSMPPVFNNSDVNLVMSRDTADMYQISLPITSEAGLAQITLVNSLTNEELNRVTSFSDPFDYVYNYTLDLSAYTESTVLMLNLNITDQAGQTVTKKIQLTINFPVIGVRFEGENLQSQFEDYNLKVSIDRGVTDLKQVDVYLGENLAESLTLDPALSSQTVNVHISGLVMGSNSVKVVVVDEFDQEFTAETTVERVAQKTWQDLASLSFLTGNMTGIPDFYEWPEEVSIELNRADFYYPTGYEDLPAVPDDNRIYCISFSLGGMDGTAAVNVAFEYDANGNVVTMRRDSCFMEFGDFVFIEGTRYEYAYNAETGDLESVTKDGAAYITDVKCENGYIVSYVVDGQEYVPTYDENGDRIDNNYTGETYAFTENPNPLYLPELPAVVPCYVFGTDLSMWLYNRYLPSQLGNTAYEVSQLVDNTQTVSWTAESGNEASIEYYYRETVTE